jgi:hypothetical protein
MEPSPEGQHFGAYIPFQTHRTPLAASIAQELSGRGYRARMLVGDDELPEIVHDSAPIQPHDYWIAATGVVWAHSQVGSALNHRLAHHPREIHRGDTARW